MGNMIRGELYKLRKDRSFKVCVITCILFSLFLVLMFYLTSIFMEQTSEMFGENAKIVIDGGNSINLNTDAIAQEQEKLLSPGKSYLEPIQQLLNGGNSSTFLIFLSVLAGTFVAAEFNNGTVKNNVTRIRKKSHFYLAKLFSQMFTLVVMVVASLILFSALYYLFFGMGSEVITSTGLINLMVYFLLKLLYLFAYVSIFVMIGFLIRGIGGTIGLTMGVIMVESLIVELFILIGFKPFKVITKAFLGRYFHEIDIILTGAAISPTKMILYILIPVLYIVITSGIGNYFFNKRDIC